jgi:hypothetical protein
MNNDAEREMSPAGAAVHNILSRAEVDPEDEDVPPSESIEDLVAAHGWPAVRAEMLELLRAYSRPAHWHTAAEVLWGALLDGHEMDADEVIAHLYYRMPDADPALLDDAINLAWSIASRLKKSGYGSAYDPREDPGVRHVLERLRSAGGA